MTTQDVKEQIYSGYTVSRVVKPASSVTTRESTSLTSSPVLTLSCLPSLEIKCGSFLMHAHFYSQQTNSTGSLHF